jgi:hypothetical protein
LRFEISDREEDDGTADDDDDDDDDDEVDLKKVPFHVRFPQKRA